MPIWRLSTFTSALKDKQIGRALSLIHAVYNFIFQIVNSRYELHFARAHGLIDRVIADRFLDGNADVLRGRSAEVLDMLSWSRGYDKSFCNDMRKRLLPEP